MLKTGVIVAASLTDRLCKPRGIKKYTVVTNRQVPESAVALLVKSQKQITTGGYMIIKESR